MIPARRRLLGALLAWMAAGAADARSSSARRRFVRHNPCPATGRPSGRCPGWVVDHVRPLKRGGADDPSNMQWQTVQEARRKDRLE